MKAPENPISAVQQHPGTILRDRYLQPLGIAPSQLARSIGVSVHEVSDLIEGRRPITPDTAARLALFFDVPPRWWLDHQARYDAANVAPVEALREVVTPYEGLSDVLITPHGVQHLPPAEAHPKEPPKATFSVDFLARLRTQAEGTEDRPRTVVETTLPDGTPALIGK